MGKTERNQINHDTNAHQKSYSTYERGPKTWRSKRRQWDYIICKVCTGCGKQLSRYDNLKGYAFCFSCREILFPETVIYQEPRGHTFAYPDSRWHRHFQQQASWARQQLDTLKLHKLHHE